MVHVVFARLRNLLVLLFVAPRVVESLALARLVGLLVGLEPLYLSRVGQELNQVHRLRAHTIICVTVAPRSPWASRACHMPLSGAEWYKTHV